MTDDPEFFIDRSLGRRWVAEALRAYDERLCKDVSALVLRNRGAGPFGLLNLVDERCRGVFDDIDTVVPPAAVIAWARVP